MDRESLRKIIKEELTKAEIRNLIDSKLETFLKEKELKDRIREITVDVIEDLYKELWQKRTLWKNSVKNG